VQEPLDDDHPVAIAYLPRAAYEPRRDGWNTLPVRLWWSALYAPDVMLRWPLEKSRKGRLAGGLFTKATAPCTSTRCARGD
jgi:hypothetical protein